LHEKGKKLYKGAGYSGKNIAPGFSLSRNTKQLVLLPIIQKLSINRKLGDFSNKNPFILGVSGGRNTALHAR